MEPLRVTQSLVYFCILASHILTFVNVVIGNKKAGSKLEGGG